MRNHGESDDSAEGVTGTDSPAATSKGKAAASAPTANRRKRGRLTRGDEEALGGIQKEGSIKTPSKRSLACWSAGSSTCFETLTESCRLEVPESVPAVRIHSAPPHSLACFHIFWRSDEIGAWGAIQARSWTRRMPTAAADGKNRSKFSVRDFGMSICEPADILRGSVLGKNT